MGATILGNGVTVTSGVAITTLPVVSPVNIVSNGVYEDAYWALSNGKLIPDDLDWKLGLGVIDTTTLSSKYFLLFDANDNEVKKISTTSTLDWNNLASTPTTIAGYGITNVYTKAESAAYFQPLDPDLSAIAELGYSSASFLKKTAANTWALEPITNYLSTATASSTYEAKLGVPDEGQDGYVLSSTHAGVRTWVAQTGGEGGGTWGSITGTLAAQTDLNTALNLRAPKANASFTGTFTLGGTALTTTFAKLNYLTSATGTTGTTSTNIVFSTSPTLVTPNIGAATGTSLHCTGDIIAYYS